MPIDRRLLNEITHNIFNNASLCLSECSLDDGDMTRLIDALRNNISIVHLDLSRNSITDVGGIALANFLQTSNIIREINLSCNDISQGTVLSLSKTKLIFINISANPEVKDHVVHFSTMPSLKTFYASECRVTDTGASALFGNNSIEELDLSSNLVTGISFMALSAINSGVKILNISQNMLEHENLRPLENNTHLTNIDISSNAIGDEGIQILLRIRTLLYLAAGQCSITDAGVLSIRIFFCEHLSLFGNNITDVGAKFLIKNGGFSYLNLRNNRTSEDLDEYAIENNFSIDAADEALVRVKGQEGQLISYQLHANGSTGRAACEDAAETSISTEQSSSSQPRSPSL